MKFKQMKLEIEGQEHINPVLAILRSYLGNQKTLAKELGVSPQYISELLNGRKEVSKNIAAKFGYKKIIMWVKSK